MNRSILKKTVAALTALALSMAFIPSACLTATADTSSEVPVWKASYGTEKYAYKNELVKCSGVKAVVIDVSHWCESINWEKVASQGITAAIINVGYIKYSTPVMDSRFMENIQGARAAGLKVGAYLYSYAWNIHRAKREAHHVLNCLEEAGITPSKLDLPVYYDFEEFCDKHVPCLVNDDTGEHHTLTWHKLAKMTDAFCSVIQAGGYHPGVYASTWWWGDYFTDPLYDNPHWSVWDAQYYTKNTFCTDEYGNQEPFYNYYKHLDLWQFGNSSYIKGIDGSVDMNFSFVNFYRGFDFRIKYELNGGTNASKNPVGYDYGAGVSSFKDPTRKGYKFKGWYLDAAHKKPVTSISKTSHANKTLYAKWKKK